jgi:ribosomal protein L37E
LILLSEHLIAKEKLSLAAWHQLQMVLGLPPLIRDLTGRQTGTLRQILEYFAAHCPLNQQNTLGGNELKLWLIHHLPEVLKGHLTFFSLAAGINNNGSLSLAVSSGMTEAFVGKGKNTEKKQDPHAEGRIRFSAAEFVEVAARQGSFCYWCGIKVVRESQIPLHNRFIKNNSMLVYLTADGLREEAIGTIDHLLRITDGGNNHSANLVISCYPCNQERDKRTNTYGRPFARRRVPCPACGGRFFHPDWGCCSICGAVPKQAEKFSGLLDYLVKLTKKWFMKLTKNGL